MNPSAPGLLNLAAYHFAPIAHPTPVAAALRTQAQALGIKGTVLVTPEGLNAFWAAPEAEAQAMLQALRDVPGFAALKAKASWSAACPFKRLKVKVKREMIRMNHPAIQPGQGRAPSVDAPTLQRWLDQGHDDQGRPVRMLDTRNAFEVAHGQFAGATHWGLGQFTEFPQAAQQHGHELTPYTVVSYCTGGIRCEKAALYMHTLGLTNVWQLEGGILEYLERTNGKHWQGNCFVFDERGTLNAELAPAASSANLANQVQS